MKKSLFKSKIKIDKSRQNEVREEAKEKIRKKSSFINRAIQIALAVVIILSLVLISLRTFANMSLRDVSKKVTYAIDNMGSGEGYPYRMQSNRLLGTENVDGNLAVVLDKKLVYLDSTAKEKFVFENNFTNPHLVSCGKYAVFYDIDTTDGIVTDGGKIIYSKEQVQKNLGERILTADISNNRSMAFATWCKDGASKISVFDSDFSKKFHYIFSSDRVYAIALSDNGKYVSAVSLNSENSVAVSKIYCFDISQEKPTAQLKINSNVVKAEYINNGELAVLTTESSFVMDCKTGEISRKKDFSSTQLIGGDFDNDSKKRVVAVSDFGGKKCTVTAFRKSGSEKFSADASFVRKITYDGNFTALLTGNSIICLNSRGRVKCEMTLPCNVDDIKLISKRLYIFSGENIRSVRVSGFAEFPADE